MKIAFITNDGKTISRHFGRASHYLVIEVQDGLVVNQEMRDKMGHSQFMSTDTHHEGGPHGIGPEAHNKHSQMVNVIQDCDALICGGMGMGAYQSMQSFGITPIVTDQTDIDTALQAYLAGQLKDQTDMLH